MAGGNDPDCRRAFAWDEHAWDHDLRAFVRGLVHLRSRAAALRADHVDIVAAAGNAVAYERRLDESRLIVAVNAGDDPVRLDVRVGLADGTRLTPVELRGGFGALEGGLVVSDGVAAVELGPRSGSILSVA